jgi:hypothetical protein
MFVRISPQFLALTAPDLITAPCKTAKVSLPTNLVNQTRMKGANESLTVDVVVRFSQLFFFLHRDLTTG